MANTPVPLRITDQVNNLKPLRNRGPHTSEEELWGAFATLGSGDFKDANIYVGSFDGSAGWERHVKGDEIVQILAGSTEFDIIVGDEKSTLELEAGMLLVVPQGCWHRFRSGDGVTVLTATPEGDEEHTHVDDPRTL